VIVLQPYQVVRPESFRDFLIELITKAIPSKVSEGLPSRSHLLAFLKSELARSGYNFESVDYLLTNRDFYSLMSRGTIILESDPHLLSNGHGHDSHLIQIAYINRIIDQQFGTGTFIRFYRYMGEKDRHLWADLFDNPSVDHLGNPSVIIRLLRPLGFQ